MTVSECGKGCFYSDLTIVENIARVREIPTTNLFVVGENLAERIWLCMQQGEKQKTELLKELSKDDT